MGGPRQEMKIFLRALQDAPPILETNKVSKKKRGGLWGPVAVKQRH